MSQRTLAGEWNGYLAVLREDAHLLLAWGYEDARSKFPDARDEYDLTGLLAEAMNARITHPGTSDRFLMYSVHNERPISPRSQRGKDRPKLDIQIERCGIRPRPVYTFEAKRLRDDEKASCSDSLADYLGQQGVQRFVAGKYAAESAEAAMLGLIQAHTPEFWLQRVEQAFQDDILSGGHRFRILEKFQRCSVVPQILNEGTSKHRRVTGSAIVLMHIVLICGE